MNLVSASQRRAVGVFLLLGVLAAAGVAQVARMPASIFPSVTFPLVNLSVDVGEAPAAQVMPAVTRPLEEAVLRVPGVTLVRSTTSRGSAQVVAQFEWGTDMQTALQRVEAEAQQASSALPPHATIASRWMNPAVFPIEGYALTSNTLSQAELLELAEYTLKPALFRTPGVSEVQISGGRKREFQIVLDPTALVAHGLSVSAVVDVVTKNNQVLSAGLTEANHELYLALVDGRARSLAALGAIAVPVANGAPVALSELGVVKANDQVSYVRTRADGAEAVLINIIRQPSANTVAIALGIEQLFKDQPTLLPPGARWSNFYDQAAYVSASITSVRDAILIGVVLAALVLLAFLRNLRLTIIAALAIPVCVTIVGFALGAFGQTLNLMTLAGVAAALGLIADDAIVVIENIVRHGERGLSDDPAESGLREILPALVGSSLSTIVIFLPFATLGGVVGAFFKPLALTMALSLAVSFVIAAFAIPMTVRLATKPRNAATAADAERPRRFRRMRNRASDGAARFQRRYANVVGVFLRYPSIAMVVIVALLTCAVLLYRGAATDFLPSMDEGSVILDYSTPPGTSLTDTDAMLIEAERIISALPDVESWSRRTGTQLGYFLTEANSGDYVIKLKPPSERRGVEEVIATLRTEIAAREPAIRTDFGQLIEDNVGDLSGGAPQPIDVRLFGDDLLLLEARARVVADAISAIPGVEDAFSGVVTAGAPLSFIPNPDALARFNMTTDALRAEVEPALQGTVTGSMLFGDRQYDVRVLVRPTGPLASLPVRTPSGALVPLSTLATVTTGALESEINRENLKTYVGVTARLGGRSLGAVMVDVKRVVAPIVANAAGVTVQYGGLYQQQQQSFQSLFYVLIVGLLLVGIVMLFEFGDWRAPLVTALTSLATIAGVLAALKVTGMTLNISSYVGAIMMAGIVGENAIFVIHEARLELGAGASVEEAWHRAAVHRLRPVAMTVLATSLALAPLALAIGAGSQLMQPLAIAVIGGFLLSGPLVLLCLPALYRLFDPHGRLGGPARRTP